MPVYLGSSPSTQWNGLWEMGPVVVSGSGYWETEIPSPKQPAFLFRKSDSNPDIALDVEDGQCSLNEVTITEIACRWSCTVWIIANMKFH